MANVTRSYWYNERTNSEDTLNIIQNHWPYCICSHRRKLDSRPSSKTQICLKICNFRDDLQFYFVQMLPDLWTMFLWYKTLVATDNSHLGRYNSRESILCTCVLLQRRGGKVNYPEVRKVLGGKITSFRCSKDISLLENCEIDGTRERATLKLFIRTTNFFVA